MQSTHIENGSGGIFSYFPPGGSTFTFFYHKWLTFTFFRYCHTCLFMSFTFFKSAFSFLTFSCVHNFDILPIQSWITCFSLPPQSQLFESDGLILFSFCRPCPSFSSLLDLLACKSKQELAALALWPESHTCTSEKDNLKLKSKRYKNDKSYKNRWCYKSKQEPTVLSLWPQPDLCLYHTLLKMST